MCICTFPSFLRLMYFIRTPCILMVTKDEKAKRENSHFCGFSFAFASRVRQVDKSIEQRQNISKNCILLRITSLLQFKSFPDKLSLHKLDSREEKVNCRSKLS